GAEGTLLNFINHLSGIASITRAWGDEVAGTGCVVRDTRKTTPGLRQLEKYAVRCGGGVNHRMGLGDAALIKDNHVIAAGGPVEAVAALRAPRPHIPRAIAVDSLEQLDAGLNEKAELVLIDTF